MSTTVASHTRLLPLYQRFRVRPSGLLSSVSKFCQANGLKDRGETNAGQWSFEDRVYGWMSGEAARILNAGEAMKPQPVNKLSAAAFCAFENIGTSSQGNCGSELSRFPTLAIGKASDQSAVWLFCAVSSRQWFQGLGVSSRVWSCLVVSESPSWYFMLLYVDFRFDVLLVLQKCNRLNWAMLMVQQA